MGPHLGEAVKRRMERFNPLYGVEVETEPGIWSCELAHCDRDIVAREFGRLKSLYVSARIVEYIRKSCDHRPGKPGLRYAVVRYWQGKWKALAICGSYDDAEIVRDVLKSTGFVVGIISQRLRKAHHHSPSEWISDGFA